MWAYVKQLNNPKKIFVCNLMILPCNYWLRFYANGFLHSFVFLFIKFNNLIAEKIWSYIVIYATYIKDNITLGCLEA